MKRESRTPKSETCNVKNFSVFSKPKGNKWISSLDWKNCNTEVHFNNLTQNGHQEYSIKERKKTEYMSTITEFTNGHSKKNQTLNDISLRDMDKKDRKDINENFNKIYPGKEALVRKKINLSSSIQGSDFYMENEHSNFGII